MDNVNHPVHYAGDKQIEVIDYIKDTLTKAEFIGYCKGNVLKYVSREALKGHKEDLEKAKVYLQWAIEAYPEMECEKTKATINIKCPDGFEEAFKKAYAKGGIVTQGKGFC